MAGNTTPLLNGATSQITGDSQRLLNLEAPFTVQAAGLTTAGAGAATIIIEVSNDNINFVTAGTITLTLGTTASSDGFAINANWAYARARITALSGTGASVSAYIGG